MICKGCKENFKPRMSYQLYCSTDCRLKNNKKANLPPSICINPSCSKKYNPSDKRQKFCSHSCSASFHNPRTKRKAREFIECLFCELKLDKSQDKFCSHFCRVKFQSFLKYEDWINGFENASDASGNLKSWARTLLLEMVGHKCSQCGWDKINPSVGKPILTVDHIDGDWSNNFCWNLIVLCYNCHTLTPTFGSLNRGSKSGRRAYRFVRDVRLIDS